LGLQMEYDLAQANKNADRIQVRKVSSGRSAA
jgi:hypothetical protein